ncbi:PspC domain-containing protein [Corynebacterium sp. AOP40-9SA-29]|uniref:PspC domain-containing protein n=1 Tax=Corynebacterium sp. AOP40-9SA-29 TaxID=3457677 RepID=UPI0040344F67
MSYTAQSTTPGTGSPRGNFESTLRRMWETRPVRFPRSQSTRSWFFGVCEGIAVRYQVSPLLVRLVFVLATFVGGVGLWAYGIALLVMRRYTVPRSPLDVLMRGERDPRFAEDRSLAIGTLIVGAVFLVFGGILSGGITLTGMVVCAAVTGVAWWLLYERQPVAPVGLLERDDHQGWQGPAQGPTQPAYEPTQPSYEPTQAPTQGQDAAPTVDLGDVAAAPGFEPPRRQPPSWDPLGTAPFAWDLPDPGEPGDGDADAASGASGAPKKKRRGLRALIVTIVLAVVLAVVAGIIALGAILAPRWGGVTSTDGSTYSGTFTGDSPQIHEVPAYSSYSYTMSSPTLDFTAATVEQDSVIDLSTTMGSVTVLFPRTTDGPSYRVHLNCESVTMAGVDCGTLDGALVRGADSTGSTDSADSDVNTLTVNVDSTMSEVTFSQVS